ncbi:hypothetical protein CCH79_00019361 [Gambusia affinis]|uniref:Carbohydrate deacetylase n=1 Tax=Gambusia affinis TaxID=33528 RepID=A0A315UXI2_GAMAF|nr:hypothetical protein CCH79_00019361 [Gambusia affinis]
MFRSGGPILPSHPPPGLTDIAHMSVESPSVEQYRHRWPDVYLGLSTMGQNMSVSSLQRALKQALGTRTSNTISRRAPDLHQPVVTVELMVHPGYPSHPDEGGCGEGPDDFSQSAEREHELNMLRSPSVLELYCQEGSYSLCPESKCCTSIKEVIRGLKFQNRTKTSRMPALQD